MNSKLEIRKVNNSSQIQEIISFCDDSFREPILKREGSQEMLYKVTNFSIFLVAYVGEDIAGYAAFYANDNVNKIAYLTLIAIKPEFQSKGIGCELLTKCEELALNNGMTEMKLEVKKYNTGAMRFYEAHGYLYLSECNKNSFFMIKKLK